MRVQWEGQRLFVPVNVTLADGETFFTRMLLDTGSSSRSSFNSPLVKARRLTRFPSLGMTASIGVGGLTSASVIRLRSIAIGQVVLREPELAISTGDAGLTADGSFGGLLAADLLAPFHPFVDFEGRRLVLER